MTSDPTNPGDGADPDGPDDSSESSGPTWGDIGMGEAESRPWRARGFSPEEADRVEAALRYWRGVKPAKNVSTPAAWLDSRFTKDEILAFARAGIVDVNAAHLVAQANPVHADFMAGLATIGALLA